MLYFSIRVVEAKTREGAIEEVINQNFIEDHPLSDVVLTKKELKK